MDQLKKLIEASTSTQQPRDLVTGSLSGAGQRQPTGREFGFSFFQSGRDECRCASEVRTCLGSSHLTCARYVGTDPSSEPETGNGGQAWARSWAAPPPRAARRLRKRCGTILGARDQKKELRGVLSWGKTRIGKRPATPRALVWRSPSTQSARLSLLLGSRCGAILVLPAMGAYHDGVSGFVKGLLSGIGAAVVVVPVATLLGAQQICVGLCNTPESAYYAVVGSTWDPVENAWVESKPYDLAEEFRVLFSDPSSGGDDAGGEAGGDKAAPRLKKSVVETLYYETLGVEPDAASRRQGERSRIRPFGVTRVGETECTRLSSVMIDGVLKSYGPCKSLERSIVQIGLETTELYREGNINRYRLVGRRPDATAAEIRKAYYVEARKCHPDKHRGDPSANARFQQLSESYQVLSSEHLRACSAPGAI